MNAVTGATGPEPKPAALLTPWGQGVTVPDIHPTFEKMIRRLERRSPLEPADRQALLGLPHHAKELPAGAHIARDGDVEES